MATASPTPECIVVGKITGVYGIKGWVKIHSFTDPIDNIGVYSPLFCRRKGVWQSIEFDSIKPHGKGLIGHIPGCDDRNQAESYARLDLGIAGDQLPALDDGDYYWHQLEGLQVVLRDAPATVLGRVDHLLETGSNDVLVVKACAGSIDKRERLIPYTLGDAVVAVDLDSQTIAVDWDPDF